MGFDSLTVAGSPHSLIDYFIFRLIMRLRGCSCTCGLLVAGTCDALKPGNRWAVRQYQITLNHPTGLAVGVVDAGGVRLFNLALNQLVLIGADGGTHGNPRLQLSQSCGHLVVVVALLLVKAKGGGVQLIRNGIITVTVGFVKAEVRIHL